MDSRLQRRVQRYGWNLAAGAYEDYWQRQLEPAQNRLLELAALEPGESVLDVACGTGLVTFAAAEAVGPEGSVLGSDVSEGMIEAAAAIAEERGLRHVRFERADAEDLGLGDQIFDAALCALGLMYFPDPVNAMRGIRKHLRPGGRAVAAVWGRRDRCGWADIFPIVDARVESEVCPLFFHLGSHEALGATFESAGYAEIQVETVQSVLHYPSADEALAAAFVGGPVALAYSRFDEKMREEAHAEYLESIEAYRTGEAYEIPGEFVVARGHQS